MKALTRGLAALLGAIAPESCAACNGETDLPGFCSDCHQTLTPGRTLLRYGFQTRAAFAYQGAVVTSLRRLKFAGRAELARPLAIIAQPRLGAVPEATLVPVPLSPKRLRTRGYNQAALLARHLGRLTNRPVCYGTLIRSRETLAQAQLDARQRRHNIRNAFAARGSLVGGSVVLVDDVVTTGSTLEACCLALRAANIRLLLAICVAHAV